MEKKSIVTDTTVHLFLNISRYWKRSSWRSRSHTCLATWSSRYPDNSVQVWNKYLWDEHFSASIKTFNTEHNNCTVKGCQVTSTIFTLKNKTCMKYHIPTAWSSQGHWVKVNDNDVWKYLTNKYNKSELCILSRWKLTYKYIHTKQYASIFFDPQT